MLTKSTIVKIVREAPIVIEAIVGELGGGQGGAQGEKQNSLEGVDPNERIFFTEE